MPEDGLRQRTIAGDGNVKPTAPPGLEWALCDESAAFRLAPLLWPAHLPTSWIP